MTERYTPGRPREVGQKENPSDFSHVTNKLLQRVLQSDPKHVKPGEMRQALGWTLDALGRDVIDDQIPPAALEQRVQEARAANTAITKGQRGVCHRALRKFWSV
jgi:hypothetical protein